MIEAAQTYVNELMRERRPQPSTRYNRPMARIILASASPRRRHLLEGLGLPFDVCSPKVDERLRLGEASAEYAMRLALEKALVASDGLGTALVVGADTIVVCDDEILAKPRDADEARSHLRRLRGRWHHVATAVAVVNAATGDHKVGIEWTEVKLRNYTDDEVEAYIASGDPFDKAGAYAIQHPDFRPVAEVRGSMENVVGLPLELTARLLEEAQ